MQGLTQLQATNEEGREDEGEITRIRMKKRNTTKEGDHDVAQAALAAVASSRSRNSLDTRRRNALPKEFRRDVDGNEVDGDNVSALFYDLGLY